MPVAVAQAGADKAPESVAPNSDYIGQELCATCHEAEAKGFADNAHTKIAEQHGKAGVTCEGCHGPGKAHMESGGEKTKILNPSKTSVKQTNQICLDCHEGQHQNFARSAHAEANVSCLDCHDIHQSKEKSLLKTPTPKLCYQCHTDVKHQFAMPFHHKVEEGVVQCNDCHDPHGSFGKKALLSSSQLDMVCAKCHTETAGPFVYEHAPVKAEGCTACHTPHGGPNARLLTKPTINGLCLECHTPSTNFSTDTNTGHNQNGANQNSCTLCHTSIHGSNYNRRFASAF